MNALAQILDERSIPVPECGCWLWTHSRAKAGYGDFRTKGKHWSAHRASYLVHFGEIPEGMHVLHKCDTPACINPAHLFLGTNADNIKDRLSKGRFMKVSNEDALEIKKLRCSGVSGSDIARQFGITESHVWLIASGTERKYLGGNNYSNKKPPIDREAIQADRAAGLSFRKIGAKHGVSYATARRYAN